MTQRPLGASSFDFDGIYSSKRIENAFYIDLEPKQRHVMLLNSFIRLIDWFDLETFLFIFSYNGYNYNTDTFASVHFTFERTKEGKVSTYPKICVLASLDEVKYVFDFTASISSPDKLKSILFFYCKYYIFS